MSDFPYLGNRISLISSSQIRYEGILYTIDTVQGTVTLAQVRSFGTEDRPTERPVAERDEIYDFIVFRGSDIKDIKLCNVQVQKTYDDPAIVEMGSSTSSGGAPGGGSTTPSRRSPTIDQGVQTQQDRQHRHRDGQRGGYHSYQRGGGGGGGGGYRTQRGGRRGGRGQSRGTFQVSARPIKFDGDFDFEEANKKFEELAAQLAKTKITTPAGADENGEAGEAGAEEEPEEGEVPDQAEEPVVFYNKTKSFFDNISCDAIEKARDNRQRRQDWQKERKQNLETFGVEGTRRPYRRGGYGRGYYNNRGGGGGGGGGGGYYGNRGGGGYYNNRGGGYYNNRGGYRGYYNNYNRGYNSRRGGGGGDGSYQRGGRSERGQEASSWPSAEPRSEAVQN
ncbi:protein LSM14 homolog B-like [Pollicipes pollicipes]|uniref:protein LSM14 homolog B-like n=1 Tax=Pollicipes pollicipes TaxID=41117 RepID=UPI001884FB72|nr:protein LSM14 homolog B-like [Pollicipes pollicipes]